jgi:hypothetical protein
VALTRGVHPYPLDAAADQARRDLKAGRFDGAAVLIPLRSLAVRQQRSDQ